MPGKSYSRIAHSSDIGLRVRGKTIDGLFGNAVAGMMSLMTDRRRVRTGGVGGTVHTAKTVRKVTVEADDLEGLLVALLNEVIGEVDIRGELFSVAKVSVSKKGKGYRAIAHLLGEPIDPARHDLKLELKACTYHGVEIRGVNSNGPTTEQISSKGIRMSTGYTAKLLFDV